MVAFLIFSCLLMLCYLISFFSVPLYRKSESFKMAKKKPEFWGFVSLRTLLSKTSMFSFQCGTIISLQASLYFISCKGSIGNPIGECSYNNVAYVIVGWITLILSLIFNILFELLFFEPNLFKKTAFSQLDRSDFIFPLAFKILLPINTQIIQRPDFNVWVILVILILKEMRNFVAIMPSFNGIQRIQGFLGSFATWITICAVAVRLFDNQKPDNYFSYYFILGYPIWLMARMELAAHRMTNVLGTKLFGNVLNYQISNFVMLFSNIMLKIESEESETTLLMILQNLRRQEITYLGVEEEIECLSKDLHNTKSWNGIFKKLIASLRNIYKTNNYLILIEAYFLDSVEKNRYAAIGRVQELILRPLDVRETIQLFLLKNSLEKSMRKYQSKDTLKIIEISNLENWRTEFNKNIYLMAKLKKQFWVDLQQPEPNPITLDKLAMQMTVVSKRVHSMYEQLIERNSSDVGLMEIFGGFLTEMESDFNRAAQVYEAIMYQLANKATRMRQTKYQLSKPTIITISGFPKNSGKILYVNDEAVRLLGYNKSDILEQNIETFMPEFYAVMHKQKLSNFFLTGEGQRIGKTSPIFILNKENFLMSSSLNLMLIPSLQTGITIQGMLSENKEMRNKRRTAKKTFQDTRDTSIYLICYEHDSGQIVYSCENSYKFLGIDNSLKKDTVKYKKLNMRDLFPNIYEPEIEQKLHIGVELFLNTNNLVEDGLESEEENLSKNSDELEFQELEVEEIKTQNFQITDKLQKKSTRKESQKLRGLEGSRIMRKKDDENNSMIQTHLNKLYGNFQVIGCLIGSYKFNDSQSYSFLKFQIFNKSLNSTSYSTTRGRGLSNSGNVTEALNYMALATNKVKEKISRRDTQSKAQNPFPQEELLADLKLDKLVEENRNFFDQMNVVQTIENITLPKIETETGRRREYQKQKKKKRRNVFRQLLIEMEENKIDVELETKQKLLLNDQGSRIFSTLNLLSIVMCVVLMLLFGFKYYSRMSMISESRLISYGVGNCTRFISHQADLAQVVRRLEVLASGGVKGDSRELSTITQLQTEATLKKFQEMSFDMYMENFDFEGAFFKLQFSKEKLQKKTKKLYKIEGGYEGVEDLNLDEIVAEFLSALFSLGIMEPASFSRATESLSEVNMARRSIYFTTKNAYNDMYYKMIDRSNTFYLDTVQILDRQTVVIWVVIIIEILICLGSVIIVFPSSFKIDQIHRNMIKFILLLRDEVFDDVVIRCKRFIRFYCDHDTVGKIQDDQSLEISNFSTTFSKAMTVQTPTNNPSFKSLKSQGYAEEHREEIEEKLRQEREVQQDAEKETNLLYNQVQVNNQQSKPVEQIGLKSDYNLSEQSDEEAPHIKRDKFIENLSSNRHEEENQMTTEKNQQISEHMRASESNYETVYTNQKSLKDHGIELNPAGVVSTREAQDEKDPLSSAKNLLSTNRDRAASSRFPIELEQINEVKEFDLSQLDQRVSEQSIDFNQKKFSGLDNDNEFTPQKNTLEKEPLRKIHLPLKKGKNTIIVRGFFRHNQHLGIHQREEKPSQIESKIGCESRR